MHPHVDGPSGLLSSKYKVESAQSGLVVHPGSMHAVAPVSVCRSPHPAGHDAQAVLARVSVGWTKPRGQAWHAVPPVSLYLPLAQKVQLVEPGRLV